MTHHAARSLHVALCVAAVGAPLAAQRRPILLDASVGAKSGAHRAAVSAWHPVVQLAGRAHLGFGLRVTAYAGRPTDYAGRGAQASLPASVTIDPSVYALSGAVFGELSLTHRVALGANLDLVGVATGPKRRAGALVQEPQVFSSFRYGAADRGALNSEFFATLRVAARTRVRVGASHYVTNYTVTDTATAGAPKSRYQRFETVPFVAVSLRL